MPHAYTRGIQYSYWREGEGGVNLYIYFNIESNVTRYTMTSHYYDGADAGKPKLRVLELRIREDGWPAVAQTNTSSDR